MYNGSVLSDVEFDLLDFDESGEVITVGYSGAYAIVDNG